MAIVRGTFYSDGLKMDSHFCAVLPADSFTHRKDRQKVLILLHGLTDGCDTWVEQTNIVRYAMESNLLVFMPEGHRSFWLDTACGGNYQKLLTEEIPRILFDMFGIITAQGNTMIAGNSMGGYGALYTAIKHPDMYAQCGAFSPVVSLVKQLGKLPENLRMQGEEAFLFGTRDYEEEQYDICSMLSEADRMPRIYTACGTEDFLLDENVRLHGTLSQKGIAHEFLKTKGEHEWDFWDMAVKRFIQTGGSCQKQDN